MSKRFFLGTIYFDVGTKNPKLVFEGFDYFVQKKSKQSTSWRCSYYYRMKCKSKLITKGSIVHVIGEHLHPSCDKLKLKMDTMTSRMVKVIRS